MPQPHSCGNKRCPTVLLALVISNRYWFLKDKNRNCFKMQKIIDYRWVAGDTSDTTCYQRQKIGDRTTEIIIPRALSLILVKIVKSRSLYLGTISIHLRTFDTAKQLSFRKQEYKNAYLPFEEEKVAGSSFFQSKR